MNQTTKLGILLSGRGSNFVAIADNIAKGKLTGCEISVVISNKADAPGLAAASARNLTALAIEANGRKAPSLLMKPGETKAMMDACEPSVSVLTEVAKHLQPGRCLSW